jgi:hypothetical protein
MVRKTFKPGLRIGLCNERKYDKIVTRLGIFYPEMQPKLH